ncbi:DUF58 domain-containing protein [Salinadaptatus halalkaliphilus]|uniref:DUF58 domain-containing protein n=1 Tax=Salinadaptatus halalkaliphilus TaxID=2419781 RepID=A0A4V3VLS9_9EURY|nr:DUF58 domain-containing protein [Salinadaptatus halalkaliphilus]THE66817.1 DUF58 domain-containing protein [Salinadaptatus halalkaliphilus]
MTDRTVERLEDTAWAITASLALAGAGIVLGSQLLVAAATMPLWYVAASVFGGRQSAMIRVHREVVVDEDRAVTDGGAVAAGNDTEPPDTTDITADESGIVTADPGDALTVRTTIQNDGAETVVDLRAIDGVPDGLAVEDGSPRTCVTLEPLDRTTIEYTLVCRRGKFAFDDVTVRARDLTGTVAETWTTGVTGEDVIRCSPVVEDVSVGEGTNDYAGDVPTDEGGTGVEFYSVRDYEPGDPVGSIDWRRYAASRELATVEFRAERSTRIVCLVDARPSQFTGATATAPPAIELSATAARRTLEALIAAGHPTGVTAIHDGHVDAVSPGTDPVTRQEAASLLTDIASSVSTPRSRGDLRSDEPIEDVPQRLPGEAQIYLFSSFVDDEPLELTKRLRSRGYTVRVVSPDVTDSDDVPTRLRAMERRTRLARARATGARVVDWERERSLGLLLRDALGEGRYR